MDHTRHSLFAVAHGSSALGWERKHVRTRGETKLNRSLNASGPGSRSFSLPATASKDSSAWDPELSPGPRGLLRVLELHGSAVYAAGL